MALSIEPHTFGGDSDAGLLTTAKRYTSAVGAAEGGLTLMFAHSLGSHKEQWEPTIERIFRVQQHKDRHERIREAWAFDWQSHGDAAVLNEELLKYRQSAVSAIEWAQAFESFIRTHLQDHRIILIGHSAGAGAIIQAMRNFPIQTSPFVAAFLVEPTILSQELSDAHAQQREDFSRMSMKATLERRDSWPNVEAAATYLRRRLPWKSWDARVFERYLTYGLHTVRSSQGPMVTIKTSKRQEGLSYLQSRPYIEAAALYRDRSEAIPFHLIFGADSEFVSRYIQDSLSDATKGYKALTVTRIPDAGHLVVQEQPDRLAVAICDQLYTRDARYSSRL